MAGPLSMANMSKADQKTLKLGQQALSSGKVSPDEVQATAGMLAQQDPTWLQNILTPKDKDKKSPYVFKSKDLEDALPTTSKSTGKGKQAKSDVKATTDSKFSTTKNLMASPDEFLSMTESIRNLPEIQEQQKALDEQQALLGMQMGQKADSSDYWVRPLAALADSTVPGSKIMSGMAPVENQGQKNARMLSAMDDLSKRKADLTKTILDGVAKTKTGSETNAQNQQLMQQLSYTMGQMGGSLANTRGQKLLADAAGQFDKDKRLTAYEQTFDSLDRAHSILYGDVPVTAALYNTLQEDFTRAITGGGNQMADAKLKREATHTLQEALNKVASYGGKIRDLRKSDPQIFAQLQAIEKKVRSDYLKSYNQRIAQLQQNYKYSDPELKRAADDKAQELRDMRGITDTTGMHNAADRQAKEDKYNGKKTASPGKTVAQAGDDVNADLSKMDEKQLAAWIKKHGG